MEDSNSGKQGNKRTCKKYESKKTKHDFIVHMVDTRQDIGYVHVGLHKFGNDVNVVEDSLAFFYLIT